MNDVTKDLANLLGDAIAETGANLQKTAVEIAAYAAERATHLSTLVDDQGFAEAVRAERDAVALEAGVAAVQEADAIDSRVVGVIQGGLFLSARILAGVAPAASESASRAAPEATGESTPA